jgi:hypothetical protein
MTLPFALQGRIIPIPGSTIIEVKRCERPDRLSGAASAPTGRTT